MKKWIEHMVEWLKTRWKWYVLGYYHCDECPYSWEVRGFEDADAGCYIKGEIYDTCRLIPPFRTIIGWPKKRKCQYLDSHTYDGYGEFYEERERKEKVYAESVKILLKEIELCQRDPDGELFPICKASLLETFPFACENFFEAFSYYEKHAHPFKNVPLKQQWKELIKLTWERLVYEKVAPYLPHKKKRGSKRL